MLKKKEKKEAARAVGRCLFWSDIPLNITKNNPFWQPVCDVIAVVGPQGIKALPLRRCGDQFFKKKIRTSTLD
jgi:hypothetical protein